MKIQSGNQNKGWALFSLFLGILGFIPSTWSFMLFGILADGLGLADRLGEWDDIWDWYYWGGGLLTLTCPSSIISLIGLIIGIIVSKRQKDRYRIATAGIALGTIGTLQFLVPLVILLVIGTW